MQALRYWDYYGMTEHFTDLYDRATRQEVFSNLYDLITSRENILLAYRTMKSNKGSKTPGTDGKTIADIEKLTDEKLVLEIRATLQNYRPKKVRRKLIEKDNGKLRPLGIPTVNSYYMPPNLVLDFIAKRHYNRFLTFSRCPDSSTRFFNSASFCSSN